MKNLMTRIFRVVKHLRYELFCGFITGAFLLFISTILQLFLPVNDPFKKIITLSTFIVVSLLLIILIKLKQSIENKLEMVSHILYDQFGYISHGNEYYRKLRHFTVEKDLLADVLVRKALPKLVEKICKERKPEKILVILDSGTTITPIFLKLMQFGIHEVDSKIIDIYTNNLAGIDEIQKPVNTRFYSLQEKNFHVIGGTPLKTHRATTGKISEDFLKTQIWNAEGRDKKIVISIVTANWVMANKNLNTIALCARGHGNLKFKEELVKNSNYAFVVAPLTKVIKIENVYTLNDITPYEDEYNSYQIPKNKKETTYLLTTHRLSNSSSPLLIHSRNLQETLRRNESKNFEFCEYNPSYSPVGDRLSVRECELPHSYLIDSFQMMYGYELTDVQ